MLECILIHIGQAGVQMGKSCWELFCYEHGIQPDGKLPKNNYEPSACSSYYSFESNNSFNLDLHSSPDYKKKKYSIYNPPPAFQSFFIESKGEKCIPRSVFVDLEPTIIDEIRNGIYRDLFSPEFLISGLQDASSNFGRGYFKIGSPMIPLIMTKIRQAADECNSLQGFILFHSCGGGTGSGLTSLIMQELSDEYPGKSILEFATYSSSQMSPVIVEPFNSVLYMDSTMDLPECTFLHENEKIFKMCCEKLNVERPTYNTLNQIIAQVTSSLTASIRFGGPLHVYLNDFYNNLVPYPRLHFPVTSFAPILQSNYHSKMSVEDITRSLFKRSNQMLNTENFKGKYITCLLMYRGNTAPSEFYGTLRQIKQDGEVQFVDWCPTNFRAGINYQQSTVVPNCEMKNVDLSACMIANTTSIVRPLSVMHRKFDLLFSKRAFLHWYLAEGMEYDDFLNARANVGELEKNYLELENENFILVEKPKNKFEMHWKMKRNKYKKSLLDTKMWSYRSVYDVKTDSDINLGKGDVTLRN